MITIIVLFAPGITPRHQVTTFCAFLPILEPYFLILFKTHLAVVVKVSELVMSNWIAKTGTLTKEVNALGLIHRQPMPPIAMLQRNI